MKIPFHPEVDRGEVRRLEQHDGLCVVPSTELVEKNVSLMFFDHKDVGWGVVILMLRHCENFYSRGQRKG